MLKDDRQIALNGVYSACRRLAEFHAQAAELSEEPGLSRKFEQRAYQCTSDADRLEALVREHGYLPNNPHKDRQDFSKLMTSIRSRLAGDSGPILIERAVELEREREKRIEDALSLDWTDETTALLMKLKDDGRRCRDNLVGPY